MADEVTLIAAALGRYGVVTERALSALCAISPQVLRQRLSQMEDDDVVSSKPTESGIAWRLTSAAVLNFVTRSVGDSAWTEIRVPSPCSYLSMWNIPVAWKGSTPGDITLRSKADDPATEKPLYSGFTEVIVASSPYGTFRFEPDDLVCYAKSASGTAALLLTCL